MQRNVGYVLLVVVLALIALGIIMLFSTSAKFAPDATVMMYSNLKHQLVWLVLAVGGCVWLSRVDYHWLTEHSPYALGLSYLLLILCFAPVIGKKAGGAIRWLNLGFASFQPSELAKLSVILFLAWWLGKHQKSVREFGKGFALPVAAMSGVLGLFILQQDLGYTALLGAVTLIMLFCAGTRLTYLAPVPFLGLTGILGIAWLIPQRQARLLAFLDPEAHRLDTGLQAWQALIAFGSGGLSGLGLGNSRQKMFWLPEAHTDFIFPIVGEELGMWVALSVVLAFLLLVLAGGWISLHAPDSTGVILGMGITSLLGLQALLNFMVVTSMLPNKGLPLPFISYGGTSLLLSFACVGILFNLHRQGNYLNKKESMLLPSRSSVRM